MRKTFGILILLFSSTALLLPWTAAAKDRDDWARRDKQAEHEYHEQLERQERAARRNGYDQPYVYAPYGYSQPYVYDNNQPYGSYAYGPSYRYGRERHHRDFDHDRDDRRR